MTDRAGLKHQALSLASRGERHAYIAERLDIPRRTISRWISENSETVDALRAQARAEAETILTGAAGDAADALVDGLSAERTFLAGSGRDKELVTVDDHPTRLKAAKEILDRVGVEGPKEAATHLHQHLHAHGELPAEAIEAAQALEDALRQKPPEGS